MFEITGGDIAALNDEDLRALVGRLCEAALCSRDLSTAAVTWSGNQTAKDGGLDVRVALPAGTDIDGFIPKADAGFQVKKQDMPRGEVLAEMKPQPTGEIRVVMAELAKASGRYISVSGAGSTADSALRSRRDAMAEAVKGMPDAEKLTLDFYDRGRMATWVRSHAGLIPWVRSKIGKSIPAAGVHGRPVGRGPSFIWLSPQPQALQAVGSNQPWRRLAIFLDGSLSVFALRRIAKVVRFRAPAIVSTLFAFKTSARSFLSCSAVQGARGATVISPSPSAARPPMRTRIPA